MIPAGTQGRIIRYRRERLFDFWFVRSEHILGGMLVGHEYLRPGMQSPDCCKSYLKANRCICDVQVIGESVSSDPIYEQLPWLC